MKHTISAVFITLAACAASTSTDDLGEVEQHDQICGANLTWTTDVSQLCNYRGFNSSSSRTGVCNGTDSVTCTYSLNCAWTAITFGGEDRQTWPSCFSQQPSCPEPSTGPSDPQRTQTFTLPTGSQLCVNPVDQSAVNQYCSMSLAFATYGEMEQECASQDTSTEQIISCCVQNQPGGGDAGTGSGSDAGSGGGSGSGSGGYGSGSGGY